MTPSTLSHYDAAMRHRPGYCALIDVAFDESGAIIRPSFWDGFRRGYIRANIIGLPILVIVLIVHALLVR